jgi:hypothetical protein
VALQNHSLGSAGSVVQLLSFDKVAMFDSVAEAGGDARYTVTVSNMFTSALTSATAAVTSFKIVEGVPAVADDDVSRNAPKGLAAKLVALTGRVVAWSKRTDGVPNGIREVGTGRRATAAGRLDQPCGWRPQRG